MALKSIPAALRPNAHRRRVTTRERQWGIEMCCPMPVDPSVSRRFSILNNIPCVGISLGIERVLAEMRFEPVERPIGIQIYGADAGIMAKAAGMVTELFEPDFVDINFGCPVKKVVKNNGGSGCLKDMTLV